MCDSRGEEVKSELGYQQRCPLYYGEGILNPSLGYLLSNWPRKPHKYEKFLGQREGETYFINPPVRMSKGSKIYI